MERPRTLEGNKSGAIAHFICLKRAGGYILGGRTTEAKPHWGIRYIFKMTHECTQRASPQQEIERGGAQIKEETQQALFYEREDWERSDV